MSCPFCGCSQLTPRPADIGSVFECNTMIYPDADARKYQSRRCLGIEHDRITRTLDKANAANERARAMICDAAGIPHDADIVEWIKSARERIARLEEAAKSLVSYRDWFPNHDLTPEIESLRQTLEAKP